MRRHRTVLRIRLALLTSMILVGVVLAVPVARALWQEPSVTAPGGTLIPPIITGPAPQTRSGSLTVSGELRGSAFSTFLPGTGSQPPRGGVVGLGGTAQNANSVAAGVLGVSNSASGAGLQAGVYGIASTNETASVGVYGYSGTAGSGQNPNAWAGYFKGASDIAGTFYVTPTPGQCVDGAGAPLTPTVACTYASDCTVINSSYSCSGRVQNRLIVSRGAATFSGSPAAAGAATVSANASRNRNVVVASQLVAAAAGSITNGAIAEGQGVVGVLPDSFTCAGSSRCSAVFGSDGVSPVYNRVGRWAGYFNGDIQLEGTLSLNGTPYTLDTTEYGWRTTRPPQFANLPSGSLLATATAAGAPWGAVFDGTSLWLTGWGGAGKLARMDPATFNVRATCNASGDDGLTYDGQYLWSSNGATLYRLDPATVVDGGSCTGTALGLSYLPGSFAPLVSSRTSGSTDLSLWYGGGVGSGPGIGLYLVEVDPVTLALRSATQLSSTPNTGTGIADDGANIWKAGVIDSGVAKLARVRKSDKAVTLFDYTPASCPASDPACLTGNVDTYQGVTVGGGSVWVSAVEGGTGTDRLLRIDPNAAGSTLLDAYAGGASFAILYDGTRVWTSSHAGSLTLYSLRVFDGRVQTYSLPYAADSPRQMTFDGTSIFLTEELNPRLIKFLH